MRMETHLQQRQEMRQHLSQRMIQNLQMLQMHVLDLRELIMGELEQNPTIEERPETDINATPEPDFEVEAPEEQAKRELMEAVEDQWLETERRTRRSDSDGEKRMEMMQNQSEKPISLQDHLKQQLSVMEFPAEIRELSEILIQNIDDNGYLKFTLEEIAASLPAERRKEPIETVLHICEQALRLIQSMEPKGIGARSLRECLLLQLDDDDPVYPLLRHVIEHHLEDIGKNRLPKIVRAFTLQPEILQMLGHPTEDPDPVEIMEDVKALVTEVSGLNPKPGSRFSSSTVPRVHPEVVLKQVDGKYEIFLEDSYLPPIILNKNYVDMARDKSLSKQEREFVKKKLDAGKMLIQAIEQRRSTIQRITAEILQRQRDFFDNGMEHLKPLKMQELADTLGIHVSTVSRAISGKWIETPRGIFPLKFFFASAAPKAEQKISPFGPITMQEPQDDKTRISLMDKIREVVDAENKKSPLSDLAIVKKLKDMYNLTAARRTIAKYREEMDIPSSRIRKQY